MHKNALFPVKKVQNFFPPLLVRGPFLRSDPLVALATRCSCVLPLLFFYNLWPDTMYQKHWALYYFIISSV